MTDIPKNIALVQQRIQMAEQQFQRTPGSVKLLAVSKGQPMAAIAAAIAVGQLAFGENYLQEALVKIQAVNDNVIEWHFIGHPQTNKTKLMAQNFQWVHGVDRLQIAERLSAQRPLHLPPLNICIEVNVSQESTKSGVSIMELLPLAQAIQQLPRLSLRGLMTIPAPSATFESQTIPYRKLANAMRELQAEGIPLDTLSMGMSNDLEAAVAEGSTLVRIGTAIFGERRKEKV